MINGRRIPHHSVVVSYLALFVALATGGAYAVEKVTSQDVLNGTLRSADLKDRQGVRGRDVAKDSVTGKEISEESLNLAKGIPMLGVNDALDCDPASETPVDCVSLGLELERRSRVLVIATGGMHSADAPPTRAACEIRVDGGVRPVSASPGEAGPDASTAVDATDGFSRTYVTPDPLSAGAHEAALVCSELTADVRIGTPTIAALAVSTGQ